MFKKLLQRNQGFTLVEVLVAILIATIFISVTMQMMVIAAVFKTKAQEYTEATTWIQEDLDNVKYKAAKLQHTSLTAVATPAINALQVADVDGFQAGDTLIIGTDSTDNTIATGGINTTTKTITLTAALGTNWLVNTEVSATSKCNPASIEAGLADSLQDNITGSNLTASSNDFDIPKTGRTGKAYTMRRTTTIVNAAPYNVLQVSYTVSPVSGGSSIANFSTEVIPDAALQCP